MRKGKKSILPWEDSVISKLVKKLRVKQRQTSLSPRGWGWVRAWKKLRERKTIIKVLKKTRWSSWRIILGVNFSSFFPVPKKAGKKEQILVFQFLLSCLLAWLSNPEPGQGGRDGSSFNRVAMPMNHYVRLLSYRRMAIYKGPIKIFLSLYFLLRL